jgi:hypothetical protein
MQQANRYDSDLQMFCELEQEVNLAKLRFVRWLIEQGRLEHAVAGPASGEYAQTGALAGGGATQE